MPDVSLPLTMVYPLDDACSEAIVAPFHEGGMVRSMPLTLTGSAGCRFEHVAQVLAMHLRAVTSEPGAWGAVSVETDIPLAGYDALVATCTPPAGVAASLHARLGGGAWTDTPVARGVGDGQRLTLEGRIAGASSEGRLTGVKLVFTFPEPGEHRMLASWIALMASDLRERIERQPWPVDRSWPAQVNPEADWSRPRFRRGLFFDAEDLPKLRTKCHREPWGKLYEQVKSRAASALAREPEDDLGLYQPWSDRRYSRPRHAARPYFHESIDLCFVGLIEGDEAMLRHAARYLMCLVHTREWSCSEESHAVGLTWTQRCFIEEMSSTAVAILLDWLDFALTPAGKQTADQALWDKGLSSIERDVMKFAYLHHNNQGPWFGRARILGGLVLEASWPHVDDYVDRAARKVLDGLDGYALEDGGTDEGVGYLAMTMHTALGGLLAYGRARGKPAREMLPATFEKLDRYVSVMASSRPGRVLLAADNSNDQMLGDGATLLASIYPGKCYDAFLAQQLEPEPDTYYRQYMQRGMLSLVFGPEEVPESRCVVPTFDVLEKTGQATSLRRERGGDGEGEGDGAGDASRRSLRLHVSGCKARPGHTHYDQGAVVAEIDGEPMLIDRGIIRYDDQRAHTLKGSAMHNVLTPIDDDGVFPDQALPRDRAIIPEASGDERRFEAKVDLTPAWPGRAEHYERRVVSEDAASWAIRDAVRWTEPRRVAFHLHALSPFEVTEDVAGGAGGGAGGGGGGVVMLEHEGIRLRIDAPWAAEVRHGEHSIDFAYRPVYRLTLIGEAARAFELTTKFLRVD